MKSVKERTEVILEKAKAKRQQRNRLIKRISVLAACACFLLAINLVLFLPFNNAPLDIGKYKDSEYYSVMQKINPVVGRKNETYKNNFDKWFGDFGGFGAKGDASMEAPTSPSSPSYEEVTNNQVNGVIEGDLFKRSSEYVYYLNTSYGSYYQLLVYSIEGLGSKLVASLDIKQENNFRLNGYGMDAELYLSADCKRVTVITDAYDTQKSVLYTCLIGVDVSDVHDLHETGRQYISGDYVSSRMTGDDLLLVTKFYVRTRPDYSKEEQFIPQTGRADSMRSIPVEEIVCPEEITGAYYTVVCRLQQSDFTLSAHLAFLSYSEEAYVSQENLYLSRSYLENKNDELGYVELRSEITCISYADGGLEQIGSFVVAGTVLNQYCMDEQDGVLRVVTSVKRYPNAHISPDIEYGESASLYCVNLTDFTIVGALEWFSPLGEDVRSARFDGDTAYVCTAIELRDPVFAIDLTDPQNITYKDTGTIDGYSLSLVRFADDTLLGIGLGASRGTLKIELYREDESSVQSVAKYESPFTDFSERFKAYLIDAENRLIGLYVSESGIGRYLLLRFDGYNLVELAPRIELNTHPDTARATVIDGILYLLGDEDFKTLDLAA